MRYQWIDAWRGLLIILVVLGHAVGGAEHFSPVPHAGPLDYVYLLIYGFHMPAFFFLAGMLWRPSQVGFIAFVKKRSFRLILPYMIWGCISIVIFLLLQKMFADAVAKASSSRYVDSLYKCWWEPFLSLLHAGGWPNGTGFRVNSVLWFFPCMFSVQIFYYLIDKWFLRFNKQAVVLLFFVIFYGLITFFYRGLILPWGLKRMIEFMPYFMLGRWFGEFKFSESGKMFKYDNWLCFGVITAIYASLTALRFVGSSDKCFLVMYAVDVIKALLGIYLSMKAVKALHRNLTKVFSVFGVASLGIMVIHKWFVLAIEMKCTLVRNMFSKGFFVAIGGVIITTIVASVASLFFTQLIQRWCSACLGEHKKSSS